MDRCRALTKRARPCTNPVRAPVRAFGRVYDFLTCRAHEEQDNEFRRRERWAPARGAA